MSVTYPNGAQGAINANTGITSISLSGLSANDGDFMIALIFSKSTLPTLSWPWVQLAASTSYSVYLLPVPSGSAAPNLVVISGFNAATDSIASIFVVRGASGIAGIEAIGATQTSSTTNIIAPSLTSTRGYGSSLLSLYLAPVNGIITKPAGQTNLWGQSQTAIAAYYAWETLSQAAAATNTLLSNNTNVSNGDTVTVDNKVYTFKTTMTPAEGEVHIGANADASLTNLANAINKSGGTLGTDYQVAAANPSCTSSAVGATVAHQLNLTSLCTGTIGLAGNLMTLAKVAATLTVGGANFSGGSNGLGATGTRTATSAGAASTTIGINILVIPAGSAATGAVLLSNPAWTVPGWAGRAYNLGYGQTILSGFARQMPWWLYDLGQGPFINDSPASTNMTQNGTAAFLTITSGWPLVDVLGTLSGTVTVASVPQAGVKVLLGHRLSGQIIKTTRSAADGTFSFTGLDRNVGTDSSYYALAIDPNGLGTQYDALIWDRLIPG